MILLYVRDVRGSPMQFVEKHVRRHEGLSEGDIY